MKELTSLSASYNPYELLRVYTYYRTLLGSILLLMFEGHIADQALGPDNPELFLFTSLSYTILNFITLLLLWRVKFLPSQQQLFGLLLVDIAAIILLMHSSGGAPSALGYLLLIAAAAGGMLLRGQMAIFLAALASIAIISESAYRTITDMVGINFTSAFLSAGILGILIFVSAIIFRYLTRKIRSSNEEALSQASHAANIQNLAQQIVERMRTGIMVLDSDNQITLFNNAAAKLLGLGSNKSPRLSGSPDLQEKVERWQTTQKNPSPILRAEGDASDEVKVNFARLEPGDDVHTLIFLEDNRAITQQAQQLKLASLGRLTASIAHEIRNPLGAISHASQLLSEDSTLPAGDKRLVEIIHSHTKRVNQIIENVLQLSRRRISNPLTINLLEWLPKFINDYLISKSSTEKPVIDCIVNDSINAKFDVSQLQQVLTNLCDNGLRYSTPPANCAQLVLEAGIDINSQQPFIKIIDFGPGINDENLTHLFEPFFTTENMGSGLGLYICKELCEANQALITYSHTHEGLSCFHIQLAHPDKTL
jgi:two-component system sensor histidine kinase PilS (NtrC family)